MTKEQKSSSTTVTNNLMVEEPMYHATPYMFTVSDIDFKKFNKDCDFGSAFYITKQYDQAVLWAKEGALKRNKKISEEIENNSASTVTNQINEISYIMVFNLDRNTMEHYPFEDGKQGYKYFEDISVDWLHFILNIRHYKKSCPYSIVEGPMADGNVSNKLKHKSPKTGEMCITLNQLAYLDILGEDISTYLEDFRTRFTNHQIAITTPNALRVIEYKGHREMFVNKEIIKFDKVCYKVKKSKENKEVI